jgi:hypothetical protein
MGCCTREQAGEGSLRSDPPLPPHVLCRAPSSEPPKHDWNCSNCTFCNDAGTGLCSVCGTAYLDPSLIPEGGAAGPAPEPWSCLVCTYRNAPAVSQCAQCNTWRPAQAGAGAGAAAAEVRGEAGGGEGEGGCPMSQQLSPPLLAVFAGLRTALWVSVHRSPSLEEL